jgi:excisionase family DNA binding protein
MTHSSVDTQIEKFRASNETPELRAEQQDILTVEEAAALLRMNRKTLYDVIRINRPRWAVRFGRSIRVSRSALLEEFRGNRRPDLGDKR